jgi:hypothetical protein
MSKLNLRAAILAVLTAALFLLNATANAQFDYSKVYAAVSSWQSHEGLTGPQKALKAELDALEQLVQQTIAYELSTDSIQSPLVTIQHKRGNCYEQALLFLQYVHLWDPSLKLEMLFYISCPEEPIAHATARVEGLEYDLTGGLEGSKYERFYTLTFQEAFLRARDRTKLEQRLGRPVRSQDELYSGDPSQLEPVLTHSALSGY